jgi:hypothetical protein
MNQRNCLAIYNDDQIFLHNDHIFYNALKVALQSLHMIDKTYNLDVVILY